MRDFSGYESTRREIRGKVVKVLPVASSCGLLFSCNLKTGFPSPGSFTLPWPVLASS